GSRAATCSRCHRRSPAARARFSETSSPSAVSECLGTSTGCIGRETRHLRGAHFRRGEVSRQVAKGQLAQRKSMPGWLYFRTDETTAPAVCLHSNACHPTNLFAVAEG